MLRMSRIFNFLKKKDPIFGKIRENVGNVPIIQKIIQHYSVVSLRIIHVQRGPAVASAFPDAGLCGGGGPDPHGRGGARRRAPPARAGGVQRGPELLNRDTTE